MKVARRKSIGFNWKSLFYRLNKAAPESQTGGRRVLPYHLKPMVITVMNQKGGCGKTTTVVNLSAALAKMGYRVLVIDMDPQAHASAGLSVDMNRHRRSVYDFLLNDQTDFLKVVRPSVVQGLDVIPATIQLAEAQLELADEPRGEMALMRKMRQGEINYDFVFVDCPPTLNLLTMNALAYSKRVLIPIQTHYYALQGMKELLRTVEAVRTRFNSRLQILGILACLYDKQMPVSHDMLAALKDFFKKEMFQTVIHMNSALVEAPMVRQPVAAWAPESEAAKEFDALAREVIEVVGG